MLRGGVRMRGRLEALAKCLFMLVVGGACGPGWTEVRSAEARLAIEMPQPAKPSDSFQFKSSGGLLTFEGVCSTVSVDRSYHPFWPKPPLVYAQSADISAVAPERRDVVLSEAAALYAESEERELHARVVAKRPFATTSCAGTELELELENAWERARFCVVGDRLFALEFTGSKRQVNGEEGRRFFESFRVLGSQDTQR